MQNHFSRSVTGPLVTASSWSARHPALAILITLAVVVGTGAGMTQAEEGRINELFVPDDLPALAVQDAIHDTWGETEAAFLLYVSDEPTAPALLRAVAHDLDATAQVDGVTDVTSLTTLLQQRIGDLDDASDTQIRRAVTQMPDAAKSSFVAKDALLARITMDRIEDIPAMVAQLNAVRDASQAADLAHVIAASPLHIEAHQVEDAGGDVGLLMPLSLATVILLLGVLFRRVQDVAVPLVTVLLSIVMAYGTVAWAGMALAPPSFIVMPLLLGLGIDYMLHIVYAYREAPQERPVHERFRTATGHVGAPVFYTAATTLIGFGSFLASNIPQIRTWGLLIGSGALYAFLLGFFFLPALYRLRRKKPRHVRLPLGRAMDTLTGLVMKRRVWILSGVLLVTAGLGTAAAFVAVEDSIEFEIDDDVPVIADFNAVQDRFGGQNLARFLVEAGDRATLETFEDALDAEPLISFVDGPIHRLRQAGDPHGPLVGPVTEDVATDAFWLVTVGYRYDDRLEALGAAEAIAAASPLDAGITGVDVMERESQAVFLDSLLKSTMIALGCVIILLFAVFRQPVIAALAFAPLVITVTWQLGIQTLIGIPINPITGVMTAMILGVGVDYSLHIMAHFQTARRKGKDSISAADAAMRSVGRPVLAASITTVFAFSVLGFSSLLPLRHFGIVAAIVVTCAFIVSLTLLPVLASYLPRGGQATTAPRPAAPRPGHLASDAVTRVERKVWRFRPAGYQEAAAFTDTLRWDDRLR